MAGDIQLKFDLIKGTDTITVSVTKLNESALAAQKSLNGLGGIFSNLSKYVAPVTAIAAGFLSVSTAMKAISAAAEAQQNVESLNNALEASGIYSEQASESLQEFANTVQRTTKYSDDAVLSNLSLLASLTRLDTDGLRRAQQAAIDFSAALGIDLDTATRLVAKATEGNVSAFTRYGIVIQKGKNDTETFANTLQALSKFQGRAEANANTFSGSIAKLGNLYDDLLKTIGKSIIESPIVIKLFTDLSDAIISMTESVKIFKAEGGFENLFLGILAGSRAVITTVSYIFNFVKEGSTAIVASISFVFSKLLENFVYAIERIGTGLNAIGLKSDESLSTLRETLKGLEEQSKVSGEAIVESLGKALVGPETNAAEKYIDDLAEKASELPTKIKRKTGNKPIEIDIVPKFDFLGFDLSKIAVMLNTKLKLELDNKNIGDLSKRISSFIGSTASALLSGMKAGAAGAAQFITKTLGGAAKTVFGDAIGGIVESLMDLLTMKPEDFTKMVSDFFGQLPIVLADVFTNLLSTDWIDQAIQKFIDNIPYLVESISYSLARSLGNPIFWVKIATTAAEAFVKSIPLIVQGFIDGIKKGIGDIFGGGGLGGIGNALGISGGGGGIIGAVGGAIGAVGDVFGFAQGGVVPGGFPGPKDTYPALLQSGERVLTPEQNRNFEQMANGNDVVVAMLGQILSALRSPQSAQVTLNLNERVLADTLLDINRRNLRTA